MCTTFLTFNLVKFLQKKGYTRLIDYPNLIRLNPNIPWKTRGNAALVIRIETNLSKEKLFQICKKHVKRFATSKRANSGLVIFEGETIPKEIVEFSEKALYKVQSLREAKEIMRDHGVASYSLRSGQGLVGALAGIGNELKSDHTFELIAYRKNASLKRQVDKRKIIEMDQKTKPNTFNNYDEKNNRVLIVPHGKDPVLLGIRGETPSAVKQAFQMLCPIPNLLGYMVFRSNQGTGEHLKNPICLSSLKAYTSGFVLGCVSSKPKIEIGGHVFFEISNRDGTIPCAAYEPTGDFRMKVLSLAVGDMIEVGGGVRKNTSKHSKVLNLEYLIPRKLSSIWIEHNPPCPRCLTTMSSEGRNQGFQCKKCGFKSSALERKKERMPRSLESGKLYLPDMKAHRHLTKPIQRYENRRENNKTFIKDWMIKK